MFKLGTLEKCSFDLEYTFIKIQLKNRLEQYTLKIEVWNLLVIAFGIHNTSHGPKALCEGPETPTEKKPESVSYWWTNAQGKVLEIWYIKVQKDVKTATTHSSEGVVNLFIFLKVRNEHKM